ncbi:hypothetical protein EG328_008451 [Venturia inaequalis]|uniref:Uncharacterized protein n=1 Tax=Venturia inaequalis TaxID=5025 RepID=A0A8H3UU39_VENIN|nr:hypothetical protein EG327_007793 [Venturia inaequalis]KAE9984617.1 hypothetical protein EG328_008451 [Venturia inaequalis]RDI87167.1 hypothetical protein Vi05172_g2795 [Venturia inaequalis]
MNHYPPSQGYGGGQAPDQRPGSTTNYGGQQQPVPGYATPPPGNRWQQPPPPNHQSQYGAQGQQTAALAYNPGVYGGMLGGQTQLPGPPPIQQPPTFYGQQAHQQQGYDYGGQQRPAPVTQQQYGHNPHTQASVSSIAPSVYQNEEAQNGQWGQPLQYSTHPPVDRYGPNAGQYGHSQQQPAHNAPQAQHYDTFAPPPPSDTPADSYFPPPQGQHPGVPLSATSTYSQDDGQQDIPPSLSGQGVAAYIPTNANPAQGVYIPPPPQNVPAWSQQQHEPLDPNFKKFKYTPRPPPKPQEYGNQTPVGQYDNTQQQGYPPPPPGQAPSVQIYNQGHPHGQQYQQYSTPGPTQQPSHGAPYLQDQYQWSQGQSAHGAPPHQYQQQHISQGQSQHSPAQSFTTPAQGHNTGSRPQSQHGQPQTWTQGQHFGSRPGSVLQSQQPYEPRQQHTHSSSISHATVPYHQRVQEEVTPVSPLQHRQSMSLDNSNDPNLNTPGIPSRSESQVLRKSIPLQPIQEPQPAKPIVSTSNASALGGFGGPSDWEHFGSAPEIDDTAMYGVKSDKEAPPSPHMASVELPTGSPIRRHRSGSQVTVQDEWESSPAVGSTNLQRPFPNVEPSGQQPPTSCTPTPPVPRSIQKQPSHPPSAPLPTSTAILVDDPDYIPPMPNTPPLVGVRLNERQPIVLGDSTATHPAPQTLTSFVMGDAVGVPPSQPPMPQYQQQPNVPQYQQSPEPAANAAGDHWQQNVVPSRNMTPRLRSTIIEAQALYNAQREVLELQARLTSAEGSLAERDSDIAQKDAILAQKDDVLAQKDSALVQQEAAIAQKDAVLGEKNSTIALREASIQQTETALKEITERQSSAVEKQEEELVKVRAEKRALEERVTQAESTLTAAKSAYDFEKGELEMKVNEAQTALAAAIVEAVGSKKQLEEERTRANAPVDIAPGLEPWFKGSLERYKEMLYTESKPLPQKEKLDVFTSFVISESRLRGVDLHFGPAGQVKGFPSQQLSQSSSPPPTRIAPVQEIKKAARPQPIQINSSPNSEGFVMVDSDEDIQYSPGGRPIMRPKLKKAASVRSVSSAPETGVAELPAAEAVSNPQAGPSNPQYQPFRRNSVEALVASGPTSSFGGGALKSSVQQAPELKQPAYMKLVFPEDQAAVPPMAQSMPPAATSSVPPLPAKEPVYRPMSQWVQPAPAIPAASNQLKQPPREEKSVPKQVLGKRGGSRDEPMVPQPLKTKGPPAQPQQALQQGSQQLTHEAPQKAPHKAPQDGLQQGSQQPRAMASTPAIRPHPTQKRSFSSPMEHLASLLPPVKIPNSETASRDLQSLRKAFLSFPSDYEFIASLTKTWDTEATMMRTRHEAERRKRQQALEKRTNELYDHDEIGYGDFDTLESQAKEEEQHLKAKEDTEEYDSYGHQVFGPVFRTLQEQIGGLMALFGDVQNLVTRAETGLAALSQRPEDTDLAEAMSLLVQIHMALEERHAEVAKAVQGRDRRYKRTQTKPLYAKGDIAAMKRVEKSFEHAEKSNEVKARIEKAERCKRLCRVIEANMERGIGVNDDFAHNILGVVEEGGSLVRPEDEDEFEKLVVRARDILKEVYGSTTRLLRHFEFMDMELNECEYAVSVASAKLKGDPDSFFERLEKEKKNEDRKLKEEWTGRVKEVEEHARAADKQVEVVLGRLGVAVGSGRARAGTAGGLSALEEAKRRNGEL